MFSSLISLSLSLLAYQEVNLHLKRSYRVNSIVRFDLSGMVALDDARRKKWKVDADFILVNDNSPRLFLGKIRGTEIDTQPWIDLTPALKVERTDLESIDWMGDDLIVVNETKGQVVRVSHEGKHETSLLLNLDKIQPESKLTAWYGIEGVASDGKNIFLSRELPPLDIFQVQPPFQAKNVSVFQRNIIGSQTDLKVRENKFFIVDRENRCIWIHRWKEVEPQVKWSFLKTIESDDFHYEVRDDKGRLHPEWSTGEAFDILNDELFLGLDSNGESLVVKKGGVKETRTSILVFEKPKLN